MPEGLDRRLAGEAAESNSPPGAGIALAAAAGLAFWSLVLVAVV
jgi:hypothetical protein